MRVDRDFVFLLNNFDIEPGSATPRIMTMLEFNLFAFNSRVFPGIDSMVVRQNDRVRIRIGNLTMTNHPIHLHGHEFEVAGTDGGWTSRGSRWPEVTVDVAVGQMRAIEFDATDVAAAKRFYSGCFGWKFTDYGPDYTSFDDGRMTGGFRKAGQAQKGRVLIVVFAMDLADAEARVRKAGVRIVKPVVEFPGGRRFHFTDPSGNELAVWSDR